MNRKSLIKIWIFIAIITMVSFSDWTFAEDVTKMSLKNVSDLLNILISILSWIWVRFAKWAWEFLTNKWVYGEVLWLDALLWKLWNVMKNMANFWLWFYFVYVVFRWLIDKEDITKKIKDKLLWLLIAWIWIQASWFLTAVVMDISTITLVAASSFSSQMVSENSEVEKGFNMSMNDYLSIKVNETSTVWEISTWVYYSLFPNSKWISTFTRETAIPLDKKITKEELFDMLLPKAESVSWPLYYIWFAILKTPRLVSVNSANEIWIKSSIFNMLLQWWTTIVYSIEMLILFIFSIMRVLYLWMFIVLSPIVVLLRCINQNVNKWWKGFLKSLTNHINFSSFLLNAFKPTIIVLWLVLATIFVTLMKEVILSSADRKIDVWWVTTFSYKESASNLENLGDQTYVSVMDSDAVGISIRHAWKTLLEFILSVLTVIIVYYIIKMSVKMWWWGDFVSKKIGKIQDAVWDFIGQAPVIPVARYDEKWNKVKGWLSLKWLASIPNQKYRKMINEYWNKDNDQVNSFMWLLGLRDANSLTEWEKGRIRSLWNNTQYQWLEILTKQKEYIKTIRTKEWKWLSLNPNSSNKFWIDQFEGWLTKMNGKESYIKWPNELVWRNMVTRWNTWDNKKQGLEKMFKDNASKETQSVKAYAEMFGLQLNNNFTWENLIRKDISSKDDTESSVQ